MEKILAVLSEEQKYAARLCDYLNRKNNLIFTAVPFESSSDYISFIKIHNVEVLLVDNELCGGAYGNAARRNELKAGRVFRLVDNKERDNLVAEASSDGFPGGVFLNKYQPAEKLIREVITSCEGLEMRIPSDVIGRPVRIIGVFSPVSRCGKTSFALTLAKILRNNRKVLYLNLEEFQSLSYITGENYSTGLSDALYYSKQKTLNAQKIYSLIYSFSGIDYIPPIKYALDRTALSGEDYIELINTILKNTLYDRLILDMDRFTGEASDLMEICDTIYMPVLDNYVDSSRVEEFMEYLKSAGRQRIYDKIVKVHTPYSGETNVRNFSAYLDNLSYGAMGDMIRELER